MATFADDFNRAGPALGSPWATVDGSGLVIDTNELKAGAVGRNISAVTGESFDDDQSAKVTIDNVSGFDFAGVAVRLSGTGATLDGYVGIGQFGDGRFYCYRVDAGVWSSLGFRSTTFIATDTLSMGIVGTTITLYKNDVAQGSTFTDATHASGVVGVSYDFTDGNNTRIDDFTAEGLAETGIITTIDETANASDGVSTRVVFRATVSETANASDVITGRAIASVTVDDIAQGLDVIAGRNTLSTAISETANASDAITGHRITRTSIADTANASDVDISRGILKTLLTETANASDVINIPAEGVKSLSIDETANAADAISFRVNFAMSIDDMASATDTDTGGATLRAAIDELANAVDTIAASAPGVYSLTINETAIGSDRVRGSTGVLEGVITATLSVSPLISASIDTKAAIAANIEINQGGKQ